MYVQKAVDYINGVLAGEIDVCEWVVKACQRQKDDLENGVEGFHFDIEKAERVCRFLELLPMVKGREGNILLLPWACFIWTTIFGWVDDRGHRRFRTALVYVPKKNAKSTFGAGIGLYGMLADGERGAEIYSAATHREQAKIVWDIASAMVDNSPGLRRKFGVEAQAYSIFHRKSGSKFVPLAKEKGGKKDGYDVHMGIVDEIHALEGATGAAMYEIIDRGTIARMQSLILGITTAGGNLAGIGYEKCQYGQKILEGKIKDESTFFIYYGIDKEDYEKRRDELFTNPKYWKKANPNWHFINEQNFRNLAVKAQHTTREQAGFLTKHLNVFIGSTNPWINVLDWDKCAQQIEVSQFQGYPAIIGVDLATRKDICSVAVLIIDETGKKYLITRHYINEAAATQENNAQYFAWVEEGHLVKTPGNTTDYRFIESDILEICRTLDVQEVVFDPHQAAYLEVNLQDEGIEVGEWSQAMQYMSEPAKIFEGWIIAGELVHDDNKVMNWMVANTQVYQGPNDQIKPVKESKDSLNKIDGVVASIFAVGLYNLNQEKTTVNSIDELISFG